MPKPYEWQALNRGAHSLEEISVADVCEEIQCAMTATPDDRWLEIVEALDEGYYELFGRLLADEFRMAYAKK